MSRDEEMNSKADEAKRRLGIGIQRSKALIAQYRANLLTLRDALENGRSSAVPAGAQAQRRR